MNKIVLPHDGVKWKVRVEFILWGSWTSVQNLISVHFGPELVEKH